MITWRGGITVPVIERMSTSAAHVLSVGASRQTLSLLPVWVFLLFALLVFSGCGSNKPQTLSDSGSLADITADYKSPVVAVVPKCTSMTFWHNVRIGAESAGKKMGVSVVWNGPASEADVAEQKRILEKFIEDKVNAIVFAACDSDALIETARRAKEQGIVVVLIDSGINDDTIPVSFVSTDNVEAGRKAGHTLAQLIDGKGKVGLIPFIRGVYSSDDREKGFKEAISCYHGITLGPVNYSQSTYAQGRKAAEEMLSQNPDLRGIFAANEAGGVGAAEAIRKYRCGGKVKLVAFDSSKIEVDALKAGIIQALVIQDPVKIGYEGVRVAVDAMNGRNVNKIITTGSNLITTEEINQPLP